MTRAQYLALCIIGAVAVAAYLQGLQIAQSLQTSGIIRKPQTFTPSSAIEFHPIKQKPRHH